MLKWAEKVYTLDCECSKYKTVAEDLGGCIGIVPSRHSPSIFCLFRVAMSITCAQEVATKEEVENEPEIK